MVQHVRHSHQREFIHYAKRQKTNIALSLAEGFPLSEDQFLFSAGHDELLPYVDLLLPWGKIYNKYVHNNPIVKGTPSVPVGSPRFDYHTSRYRTLCLSKETFCRKCGIAPDRPTLMWMTNTIYANPPEGYDQFIAKMKDPSTSDSRIANIIEPLSRDHQRVFDTMSDAFENLGQDFPELNILIKIHPSEPRDAYERKYKGHPTIKVLPAQDITIADYIVNTDIMFNWRCTTAAEAWLVDIHKPVISLEPKGMETDFYSYLTSGNDVVRSYESLHHRVQHYLNGGQVSDTLVTKRQEFVRDYLAASDGRSAERCADALVQHVAQKKRPLWAIQNIKIWLKYLPRYRFNKRWLALPKNSDHPKYIEHELIHQEMNQLMKLHNKKVEYRIEM